MNTNVLAALLQKVLISPALNFMLSLTLVVYGSYKDLHIRLPELNDKMLDNVEE